MGKFPSPLGPKSDYWLKRGRWIPSTPWESLFNAVAQWMGVHDDEDLDWVLPNRESFKSHALHGMCDLFTDKDLFTDGACECKLVNGVQATVCDDITYAPTPTPSGSPTYSPATPPTATPSSQQTCVDSPLIMIDGRNGSERNCNWVTWKLDQRCGQYDIASHCPGTCDFKASSCNTHGCDNSLKTFLVDGERYDCDTACVDPSYYCEFDGVPETCRKVCGFCNGGVHDPECGQ